MNPRVRLVRLLTVVLLTALAIAGRRWGWPAFQRFKFREQTTIAEKALAAAAQSDSSALAELSAGTVSRWLYPVFPVKRQVFAAAAASGHLQLLRGGVRNDTSYVSWAFPFLPDSLQECGPRSLQGVLVRAQGRWKLIRMGMPPC